MEYNGITKARKNHTCTFCDRDINSGEEYIKDEGRAPKYDKEGENQIGIEFYRYKTCLHCIKEWEEDR